MVFIARAHVDETWLCHVDARDGLRGSRMTRVHVLLLYYIFYNGYSTYKHSIEEFKLAV